ncbi:MAG: DUF3108 domain-containing protein [Desulfuromonadaceae bacterium]|nr:DUF3108 domain-containing protein [Desulfuromonadaceae bacterium]
MFGFDQVAKAEISFREEGQGQYRALLDAWTLGVASKLSGDRRQTYQAVMELGPDAKFRPLRFEQTVSKKDGNGVKVRVKRYDFDYDRESVRYVRIKNGKEGKPVFLAMKKGTAAADFLTTFVNYRMGFYGRPHPGKPLILETFARGGYSQIRIEATSVDQLKQREFFQGCPGLNRVILDPEVFDTGGGDVFVCLDGAGRPLRGAVENVLNLGDVLGRLIVDGDESIF